MEITPKICVNVKFVSNSSSSYVSLLNKELSDFPELQTTHYFPLS